MLLMTHVKMAKILGTVLQVPNTKKFLEGVRIPDSGLNPFIIRHTKENTLHEVKLLLDANESKWITSEAFSYNLGVIIHYTMDYFCKYHENDTIFKHAIKHTFYELKLDWIWTTSFKYTIEKFLLRTIVITDNIDVATFDAVDFLEMRLNECYSTPPSPEKDLEYAFITSYIIGLILTFKWHSKYNSFEEDI